MAGDRQENLSAKAERLAIARDENRLCVIERKRAPGPPTPANYAFNRDDPNAGWRRSSI